MTITINSRSGDFAHQTIRYEDVRDLAGLKGNPSCTWRTRDGRGGTLSPGNKVVVYEGMVFNIVHTGNA